MKKITYDHIHPQANISYRSRHFKDLKNAFKNINFSRKYDIDIQIRSFSTAKRWKNLSNGEKHMVEFQNTGGRCIEYIIE